LTEQPSVPSEVNKLFYEDIPAMLSPANQAQQTEQITMCVADATADPFLTFPAGETRLQAYYRYLGTTTGTMADYELISAPYGNHTKGTLSEVLSAGNTSNNKQEAIFINSSYGKAIVNGRGIQAENNSGKQKTNLINIGLEIGNGADAKHLGIYYNRIIGPSTLRDLYFPPYLFAPSGFLQRTMATVEDFTQKPTKTVSASTYTLLSTDKDLIIHFTHATGCTVTIPTSLPINNRYEGKQRGDGQITFVGAGGVTVNVGASETNKTLEKFSVWGLDCVATNEYDLFGKLELV
jgi:hypothetical protein